MAEIRGHMIWECYPLAPVQEPTPDELSAFLETANRCAQAVGKIEGAPDVRGSGVLIHDGLVLTCAHVFPKANIAGSICFKESSKVYPAGRGHREITYISAIKSGEFFISCFKDIVPPHHLDITVFSLEVIPYLSEIQEEVFSILNKPTIAPRVGDPICVIAYPDDVDPKTGRKGRLRYAFGNVTSIENERICYDAKVNRGSSGGAVINEKGELIAINQGARPIRMPIDGKDTLCELGVRGIRIEAIVEAIRRIHPALLSRFKPKNDESAQASKNEFQISEPTREFVGREEDLQSFESFCSDNKLVAVSGPEGVGKTEFVQRFAQLRKLQYPYARLFRSSDARALLRSLQSECMNAEHHESPNGIPEALEVLAKKIDDSNRQALIVFDAVDKLDIGRELASSLEPLIRPRKTTHIVLTSRIPDIEHVNVAGYPRIFSFRLDGINSEKAAEHLINLCKIAPEDTVIEKARELVHCFDCIPLFIRKFSEIVNKCPWRDFCDLVDLVLDDVNTFESLVSSICSSKTTLQSIWQSHLESLREPDDLLSLECLYYFFNLAPESIRIDLFYDELIKNSQSFPTLKDEKNQRMVKLAIDAALATLCGMQLIDIKKSSSKVTFFTIRFSAHLSLSANYSRQKNRITNIVRHLCNSLTDIDLLKQEARCNLDSDIPHIKWIASSALKMNTPEDRPVPQDTIQQLCSLLDLCVERYARAERVELLGETRSQEKLKKECEELGSKVRASLALFENRGPPPPIDPGVVGPSTRSSNPKDPGG